MDHSRLATCFNAKHIGGNSENVQLGRRYALAVFMHPVGSIRYAVAPVVCVHKDLSV